jgi:C4-dicarboxylate-specific signal transduction histidine kinase
MISRNATRISTLIDDLLKSARPPELEIVSTTLQEIINSSIEFCQDRIKLLDIELTETIKQEPVEGRWDPEKLKIALVNILTNAMEAMNETENPSLEISLNVEGESNVILIKDNGKGMDKETQNNIFDPFFTNRKNGLGLGMTATLNIISMHKGKIQIQSEVDKGTTFKVIL